MTAPVAPTLVTLSSPPSPVPSSSRRSGDRCGTGGLRGSECYRHVSTPPVYGTVQETCPGAPAPNRLPHHAADLRHRVRAGAGLARRPRLADASRPLWRAWSAAGSTCRRDTRPGTGACWCNRPSRSPRRFPPEYASVQRRVLVEPARSGWVPARGGFGGTTGYGQRLPIARGLPGRRLRRTADRLDPGRRRHDRGELGRCRRRPRLLHRQHLRRILTPHPSAFAGPRST